MQIAMTPMSLITVFLGARNRRQMAKGTAKKNPLYRNRTASVRDAAVSAKPWVERSQLPFVEMILTKQVNEVTAAMANATSFQGCMTIHPVFGLINANAKNRIAHPRFALLVRTKHAYEKAVASRVI